MAINRDISLVEALEAAQGIVELGAVGYHVRRVLGEQLWYDGTVMKIRRALTAERKRVGNVKRRVNRTGKVSR